MDTLNFILKTPQKQEENIHEKKLNTSRTLAVSESSKSEKDLLLFSVTKKEKDKVKAPFFEYHQFQRGISARRSDNKLIGMLDIRKELNEDLLNFYGNIGYSIRHSERRKGYATMQLKLAKEICRNMGMKKILISCYKENPASAKIILRSGGVLENEVVDQRNGKILQRYWITL